MILRLLDNVMRVWVVAVVAITATSSCLAVFFRYVLNDALSWPEELSGYLLVWITFGGGYLVARDNAHISFDLFVESLPGWTARSIHFATNAMMMIFLLFLFYQSSKVALEVGSTPLLALEIVPEWVFMISIPIFAAGTFLHLAMQTIRDLKSE